MLRRSEVRTTGREGAHLYAERWKNSLEDKYEEFVPDPIVSESSVSLCPSFDKEVGVSTFDPLSQSRTGMVTGVLLLGPPVMIPTPPSPPTQSMEVSKLPTPSLSHPDPPDPVTGE